MHRSLQQFLEYLRSAYSPDPVEVRTGSDAGLPAQPLGGAAASLVIAPHQTLPVDECASFQGWSPDGDALAIVEHGGPAVPEPAPATFRVAAIVPTFNEADVIEHTLRYLVEDHVDVYVIDNWSTDGTLDIVQRFAGRGLLGAERFPSAGTRGTYDLRAILERVEAVALDLDADWIVLHDADERRRSPWRGVSLRDALYHVDRHGFTSIDHVTLTFWPIDNGYMAEHDVEAYFPFFEFSNHPGHFHQRRAWKNRRQRVALAPSAGHDVRFDGRRVYPFKFLLKHYPIRSQQHGERKVLHERRTRWNREERALGWHAQYDGVQSFVRDAADLERFDEATFFEHRLIERLSGVGIFDAPPAWATPPVWEHPSAA